MTEWIIQKWAAYWHGKFFRTNNYRYWIIGSLPVLDGFSDGKIKFWIEQ